MPSVKHSRRGIAWVCKTPAVSSSDIIVSSLKGNSAGRKRATVWNWIFWSSISREEEPTECVTMGTLSGGADIKRSSPFRHTPAWNRDAKWQDISYKEVLFDTRGDFILHWQQYKSCSTRLQGLIAGPVRFTHIFSWNNHPAPTVG